MGITHVNKLCFQAAPEQQNTCPLQTLGPNACRCQHCVANYCETQDFGMPTCLEARAWEVVMESGSYWILLTQFTQS